MKASRHQGITIPKERGTWPAKLTSYAHVRKRHLELPMTTNVYFTYQSIIDLGQPRGKTVEDLLTLADPALRVELVLRMEDLGPPSWENLILVLRDTYAYFQDNCQDPHWAETPVGKTLAYRLAQKAQRLYHVIEYLQLSEGTDQ